MVIFKRTSMAIGLLLTTAMAFADAKTYKMRFMLMRVIPKS